MGDMTRRGSNDAHVGDGIRLLARVTGRSEEKMAADRGELAGGLHALGSLAMGLLRDYASEDPAIREAAYRRWAELDAMLPKPDPHAPRKPSGLSEAEREGLHAALARVVDALRQVEDDAAANRRTDAPPDRGGSMP